MKITAKEQYGLRAMTELVGQYGKGPVPLSWIAEAQELSLHYLEQIVPSLREAGLITSRRGAHGGYELARAPDQITVGAILRALDGEILPVRCLSDDHSLCDHSATCTARTVWETIHGRVLGALDGMTLADL